MRESEKKKARDWVRGLLKTERTVAIWKRNTEEADQRLELRGSVELDEGLDFSNLRRDNIDVGLFWRVRYRGRWLQRKLKGVFRR